MSAPPLVGDVDVQQEWANWVTEHSKVYETPEEEQKRFQIFENTVKEVQEHNRKFQAGEVSYSKALNQFADQTSDEFKSINQTATTAVKKPLMGSGGGGLYQKR